MAIQMNVNQIAFHRINVGNKDVKILELVKCCSFNKNMISIFILESRGMDTSGD
jgi:hypothetical protein